MKGNDGSRRGSVAEFVQDQRRLRGGRSAAQYFFSYVIVHVDVGLVQPEAPGSMNRNIEFFQMRFYEPRRNGDNLFEHLGAVLFKQLVRFANTAFIGPVEKPEVVAHIA